MTELRWPNPMYQGRNGFIEPMPTSSAISDSSWLEEETKKHCLVEWVLERILFPVICLSCFVCLKFPSNLHPISLEEMERLNMEPEMTATIKKQINKLKMQHSKDMESLYSYYAQVY
jgi:hypothetical protein